MKSALAYDIRTTPLHVIEPLLSVQTGALRATIDMIFRTALTDNQWSRVQLSGRLGGMGVRMLLSSADAAFIATYRATAGRVSTV